MAAQPWKVYNLAKKKIGNGTLNLAGTAFRIALVTSASNFASYSLGVYNSVSNEVANGNGYATGGGALAAEVWTVGASNKQYKFDADDFIWTATGGAINSIKAAVIYVSAAASANRHLLCFASLTSSQFNLAIGNTLTIQMAAGGILTLA